MSRVVLITGCSSGIGRHCALALKRRGWRVFATARRPEDLAELEGLGLETVALDLACEASIEAAVEEVTRRAGRIDALFNNAAYGQPGAVEDLTRDVLRTQFEVNVFGTQSLTNRVIAVMRLQGGGRIVHNSSVLGLVSLPFRGAYNASKHALEALADTQRLELHDSGIHLSLIEPGPIQSRFREHALTAFRRYIDVERSPHRTVYRGLFARLTKKGPAAPGTLAPEAVCARLIHALESPRPRPRYYVTWPTWLFATLKRLLPTTTLDRVLRAVSRRENR